LYPVQNGKVTGEAEVYIFMSRRTGNVSLGKENMKILILIVSAGMLLELIPDQSENAFM
jgi:hypothetical protein